MSSNKHDSPRKEANEYVAPTIPDALRPAHLEQVAFDLLELTQQHMLRPIDVAMVLAILKSRRRAAHDEPAAADMLGIAREDAVAELERLDECNILVRQRGLARRPATRSRRRATGCWVTADEHSADDAGLEQAARPSGAGHPARARRSRQRRGRQPLASIGLIAWKTGYNRRNVQRIMARLAERGVVVVVAESEAIWRRQYQLHVDLLQTRSRARVVNLKARGDKMSPRELLRLKT